MVVERGPVPPRTVISRHFIELSRSGALSVNDPPKFGEKLSLRSLIFVGFTPFASSFRKRRARFLATSKTIDLQNRSGVISQTNCCMVTENDYLPGNFFDAKIQSGFCVPIENGSCPPNGNGSYAKSVNGFYVPNDIGFYGERFVPNERFFSFLDEKRLQSNWIALLLRSRPNTDKAGL